MSWKLQALVSERICGSITRKMVLINMASRANDDGTGVYAALPTIAGWCEIDARSVRRVVRDLEQEGLIRLVGSRPCKTGAVNDWTMNVPALSALPLVSDEVAKAREIKAAKQERADTTSARTLCPPGQKVPPDIQSARTLCPERADTVSAKPILEPKRPTVSISSIRPDVDRAFVALWGLWPAVARKRHTQDEVKAAIASQLRHGATPDQLIDAGKAHVRERMESGAGFVKGLVPWLSKGLWRNWLQDEPATPSIDWPAFIAIWRESGAWPSSLGPAPGEPGYRGPPISEPDLFAAGGKQP